MDALEAENPWQRLSAAIALDELGAEAAAARPALQQALLDSNPYVVRVSQHALSQLTTD